MGKALLAWSASMRNFAQVQANHSLFGWHESLVDIPCSWSCILCSQEGQLMDLGMRYLGLQGLHTSHLFNRAWSCTGAGSCMPDMQPAGEPQQSALCWKALQAVKVTCCGPWPPQPCSSGLLRVSGSMCTVRVHSGIWYAETA